MDVYAPPKSKLTSRSAAPRRVAAVLVTIFIVLNLTGIAQTIQVLNIYGFSLSSDLGEASLILMGTLLARSIIAALYFFRVRWFYWILLGSMLVVYPLPNFPLSLANSWLLLAIVFVLGWAFALSQRQYLLPWRDLVDEEAGQEEQRSSDGAEDRGDER